VESDEVTTVPSRPAGRDLTSRASLNGVAAGLDYSAKAAVELVVSPLLVSGLGAQVFGAWRVLWQWSSYVWGASGRSAQALQFAIANRQWTASPEEKRRLVGSAVAVWLMFLPLLLAAGALGVWLGPGFLDVPAADYTEVRVAAAVLVVDSMAVTLLTLPRSALQGENLGYTRMGVSTLLIMIGGGLLVLAVKLDLGLVGVAGATLVTSLLTGWVFWRITRRRLPWYGIARPSRKLVRWFFGLSTWFLGWKFVLEAMIASDVLVLAGFASLSLVAAYALTKFVAESLSQALGLLVQATIPGIGGYLGAGRLRKAATLRGEVMALVWLVGTAAGATIVIWNGSFVGLWVGDDLYAGHTATLLIVVLGLQIAFIKADTFIIDVALIPRVKVVAGAISAVVSIGLAIVGIGVLDAGVTGLCVGLIAGRSILGLVAPWSVGRVLGQPVAAQLRAVVRPLAVTAVVLAGALYVGRRVEVESWLRLVPAVALTAVAIGVVTAYVGLRTDQRRRLAVRARVAATRLRGGEST
jgi:O-antigen/teichoic acid export membrane protein